MVAELTQLGVAVGPPLIGTFHESPPHPAGLPFAALALYAAQGRIAVVVSIQLKPYAVLFIGDCVVAATAPPA
ncbi:unannotated protein [freshwater metagenome]|uniref:Unannotated protein n=1 Tax=freshwater metagenome TaxID=449393 RepID=A0A6J6EWH3_9ZZZZ